MTPGPRLQLIDLIMIALQAAVSLREAGRCRLAGKAIKATGVMRICQRSASFPETVLFKNRVLTGISQEKKRDYGKRI